MTIPWEHPATTLAIDRNPSEENRYIVCDPMPPLPTVACALTWWQPSSLTTSFTTPCARPSCSRRDDVSCRMERPHSEYRHRYGGSPREARDKAVGLPPYLQHSRAFDLRTDFLSIAPVVDLSDFWRKIIPNEATLRVWARRRLHRSFLLYCCFCQRFPG